MKCWRVRAEPDPCPGVGWTVLAVHLAALAVPWAAGVRPLLALALNATVLAGLHAAAATVPGPRARLRRLECGDQGWLATLADGTVAPARVLPATRVMPGVVFCRLAVAGRRLGWIIPACAMPAGDFRRLKAALRAAAGGPGGAAC